MMDINTHVAEDQRVEVHKFYTGGVTAAVVLALRLEAFLRATFRWADLIELPLLVTIYFALSRRNPSGGLMLGMIIGLLQDSLSHTPIGFYGIAKTLVGYMASSLGSRIDLEHPIARFFITAFFVFFHNSVLVFMARELITQQQPYLTARLLAASVVNSLLAVAVFPLLDRFRRRV
jgi:rod shape-determining protein MreD